MALTEQVSNARAEGFNRIIKQVKRAGCGYRNVWRADTPEALEAAVADAIRCEGPNLVHVKVAIGSAADLGRPALTPVEVKQQFMAWFAR